MKNKPSASNKSVFQLEFDDGGKMSRRKTALLADGAYFFEDELKGEGAFEATIITCAAWLLEHFELKSGEIFFLRGEEQIRPKTKIFAIFYPPFSITRVCFRQANGYVKGLAALEVLPKNALTVPTVFESSRLESQVNLSQAAEIITSGKDYQAAEASPKASLLSVKAKKLIDENYLAYPLIFRIAARLGVSHAHLARQFKTDFGMSPSNYFRQLRMADAPLLLAKGEAIINVAQDVGYNDLSRFYKQFRQTTRTSPGACQSIMKPENS